MQPQQIALASPQSYCSLPRDAGSQRAAKVKLALQKPKDLALPDASITAHDLRGDKRDVQGLNWIELTGRTAPQGRPTCL